MPGESAVLDNGIASAAAGGAEVVFLPELTLSRYPADTKPVGGPADLAEDLHSGPTFAFAADAARAHNVLVHASLYERVEQQDHLGFNTSRPHTAFQRHLVRPCRAAAQAQGGHAAR